MHRGWLLLALFAVSCSRESGRHPLDSGQTREDAGAPAVDAEGGPSSTDADPGDAGFRPPECIEYEGTEYCAPFTFEGEAEGVSIAGFADVEAVENLLPPTLKPVTVSGQVIP